jgi:dephospho-CoA kinase
MSYRLGLTGSIGMGKSTTAAILLQYGVQVWDADGAVHRLYSAGGAAVAPIAALCPEALVEGGLDRSKLRAEITINPDFLQKIQDNSRHYNVRLATLNERTKLMAEVFFKAKSI